MNKKYLFGAFLALSLSTAVFAMESDDAHKVRSTFLTEEGAKLYIPCYAGAEINGIVEKFGLLHNKHPQEYKEFIESTIVPILTADWVIGSHYPKDTVTDEIACFLFPKAQADMLTGHLDHVSELIFGMGGDVETFADIKKGSLEFEPFVSLETAHKDFKSDPALRERLKGTTPYDPQFLKTLFVFCYGNKEAAASLLKELEWIE